MIILDTNVISALMREPMQPAVLAWLDRQPRISVWTTAITLMELRFGIDVLAPSRRRTRLQNALDILITVKIEHRIAAFDASAATVTAGLMGDRRRSGRTGELRDAMIGGIAIANHATLATRNARHFADLSVPVVDPWTA